MIMGCGMEETCSSSFVGPSNTNGCLTNDEIHNLGNVPLITITPNWAVLAVEESQTFEVRGGHIPLYVRVAGCLGDVVICEPIRLNGDNNPFSPVFRIARYGQSGRIVTVTFLTASLRPAHVQLEVWGSNRIGQLNPRTIITVPLHLIY